MIKSKDRDTYNYMGYFNHDNIFIHIASKWEKFRQMEGKEDLSVTADGVIGAVV